MKWFRRESRRSRSRPRAPLVLEVLEERSTPATFTWSGNGANANWNTPANWVNNAFPVAGADLNFPANALRLTNSDNLPGVTFKSITFSGGGYTINGTAPALILTGALTASNPTGSSDTINVPVMFSNSTKSVVVTNTSATLNLTQTLSGAGNSPGLIVTGSGILDLSGNNSSFAGPIDVQQAATLDVGSGTALGSPNVNVSVEGQLNLENQTVTLGSVTLSGYGEMIVGGGMASGLTVNNLTMSSGLVMINTQASLTLDGGITATSTGLGPAVIKSVGTGSMILSPAGHNFSVTRGPAAVDLSIPTDITSPGSNASLGVSGTGILDLGGTLDNYGATVVNSGDVQVDGQTMDVLQFGGNLSGTGTVGSIGGITDAAQGIVAPGDNGGAMPVFGTLHASGAVFFGAQPSQTTFDVNLSNGHSPGAPVAGVDYDQLTTAGNAAIGGAILTGTSGAAIRPGDTFTILQAGGTVSGLFCDAVGASIPEGGTVVFGSDSYLIHYTTHAVTLTRALNQATVAVSSSTGATAAIGQPVTFTATVSPISGGAAPTGTVTFSIDGVAQPAVAVSGGQAGFTTSALSAGSHSIGASYSGDTNFAPAQSASVSLIVGASPHGVIATAIPLGALGEMQIDAEGVIAPGTDVVMYSFTVTAGQTGHFETFTPVGAHFDDYLRLFDANGNQVAFNDDGPSNEAPLSRDASFVYQFPQSGTYYIAVSGYPNFNYNPFTDAGAVNGSTGSFHFDIDPHPKNPDSNGQLSDAQPVGAVSQARHISNFSIAGPNDVVLFRFTVRAGQEITIQVSRPEFSELDSVLRLFDAKGVQIAGGTGSGPGGLDATLTFKFKTGGTYYVGVSGRGNIHYNPVTGAGEESPAINAVSRILPGSVGDFSLALSPLPIDRNHKSRLDEATPLQHTASSVLRAAADVRMFSFVAATGQSVSFTATASAGLSPYLRLFDGNGVEIANSGPGSGPTAHLAFTFLVGETYYLGVSAHGNSAYDAVTGAGTTAGHSSGAFRLSAVPTSAHTARTDTLAIQSFPSSSAAVTGLVFFDKNNDGRQEPGDVGEPDHMVFLDLNHNGIRDDGEPATFTNAQGLFLLDIPRSESTPVYAMPIFQFGIPVEKVSDPGTSFYTVHLVVHHVVAKVPFGMSRVEA